MSAMDKRTPYVFESQINKARTMGKIFFGIAIFAVLWDVYSFIRHGHTLGGVFMGMLFGLVAGALYTLRGTITVSSEVYRCEYTVYGLPLTFETPIKGWQILHVDYDSYDRTNTYSAKEYIRFYLSARDDGQPWSGVVLSDIDFELDADPTEVAAVIKKLKDATGFKLTFGGRPLRDIYPTYQKLYGDV